MALNVKKAATPKEGILQLTENQQKEAFETASGQNVAMCKFVPASGAATRMFDGDPSAPAKGLVVFHNYADGGQRTAFEEHLVEGALYAREADNTVNIHFTVSASHLEEFENLLRQIKDSNQKRFGCKYNIDFSCQDPKTDITATYEDGSIVLDSSGKPLRRAGGHGALIHNLNAIEQDYIFIKNIDNVVKEDYLKDTVYWKRVLLGRAIGLTSRAHLILLNLVDAMYAEDGDKTALNEAIAVAKRFLEDEFCIHMQDSSAKSMIEKLNRPIRVCGMVRNEGESGGGPFIVTEEDGSTSLQIVEKAQLTSSLPAGRVQTLLQESTHFNPVDIVCSVKNFANRKFDLAKFIDKSATIDTVKSYNGKTICISELPGLWNGAMSKWNTQFIEVPVSTFNPVKTFADLKRPMHV